jgi:hypothetical protein
MEKIRPLIPGASEDKKTIPHNFALIYAVTKQTTLQLKHFFFKTGKSSKMKNHQKVAVISRNSKKE